MVDGLTHDCWPDMSNMVRIHGIKFVPSSPISFFLWQYIILLKYLGDLYFRISSSNYLNKLYSIYKLNYIFMFSLH